MAEGSSNSSGAPLPAGAVERIGDTMRGLELSRPPPAGRGVEANVPDSGAAGDWSHLQQDLLIGIFSRLDLPDLICSGAVCTPWRVSYLAVRRFRLCSPNQSPYLVYSSGDRDSNTATLHNLSTNKPYHFSLPDPPFRSRYIVGSSQGWLVTADKQSNLHLLNPVTGAQVSLPPAQSIKGVSLSLTSEGELHGHNIDQLHVKYRSIAGIINFFPPAETRQFLYKKVIMSSDPSGGDCVVLLKHGLWNHLSFARIEDTEWTWLDTMDRCDQCDAEIHTIDLKGPSPMVKVILKASTAFGCPIHYILRAPWGDLFLISRIYAVVPPDSDDEEYLAYHQALEDMYLGPHEPETDDEEECPPEGRLTVRRVELAQQKFTEITNLQGHVLFVGFNDTFMIHAREFPSLSPNHVFMSDDFTDYIICSPFTGRRLTCLNLEDATLTDLSFSDSLLDWPPPVWFRPHLA